MKKLNLDIINYINEGITEVLVKFLNFVDNDGMFTGYNFKFIESISSQIRAPLIVCGGARGNSDFKSAIDAGADACAAGILYL